MELGTQVFETQEVGVQTATAYLVATRLGNHSLSHTRQQWTNHHDGATQVGTLFHELVALQILQVQSVGLECVGVAKGLSAIGFRYLDTDVAQQLNQVVDITDVGDVVDGNLFAGEQRGADNL